MIHHRQRLPLRLKAGDGLLAVKARLDDRQRHQSPNRLLLLGHEDEAHPPFADLLKDFVMADLASQSIGNTSPVGRHHDPRMRPIQKAPYLRLRRNQLLDMLRSAESFPHARSK